MGQCASSQHHRGKKEDRIAVNLTDESLLSPRGTHAICDGYVDPQRLATQMRFFRRQVQKQKLAPFWLPEDEESANGAFEYCSICACYYKSVNVTECCKFQLCSECHARNVNGFAFREEKDATRGTGRYGWIRSRRTRAAATKPSCVCCRQEDYKILYRGMKTKKELEKALEEKKQTEMYLERAKVGVEEESRRRQSLAREGNGERGDVPKGWEEEYSMARLAEEGGSPRARQEIAEMGFDRVALRVNGRNSSGLTPSQRMSLLRGRSEMFAEMYDALFDDDGAADGDRRGSQRSRRSFDLGSRRNSQEFRRNSEEFFQRGTLPSLTESEENTTSTTATTTRSIQEQRRLVQDFRNMVLEELYLSEAIYRSMLDVHEDESENVHPHVEEEEGEEEEEEGNNSETEDASDFEEPERDQDQTGTSRYASSTSRDTSSDSEESEENYN